MDTVTDALHGIHNSPKYGPAIAGGVGLYIYDKCNLNNESKVSRFARYTTNHAGYPVDTYLNFTVVDYECWALTKMPPSVPTSPASKTAAAAAAAAAKAECRYSNSRLSSMPLFHFPYGELSLDKVVPVRSTSVSTKVDSIFEPNDVISANPTARRVFSQFHTVQKITAKFFDEVNVCKELLLLRAVPVWNEIKFCTRHVGIYLLDHVTDSENGDVHPSIECVVEEMQTWVAAINAAAALRKHTPPGAEILTINAFDSTFTIKRQTLLAHTPETSLLYLLASDKSKFEKDEEGHLRLDIDPDLLSVILSHLRMKELLKYNTTRYVPKLLIVEEKKGELERLLMKLKLPLDQFPIRTVHATYRLG